MLALPTAEAGGGCGCGRRGGVHEHEGPARPAVQRVRVLGALALVDGGETDWKLLVVDVDAADAPAWRELGDEDAEPPFLRLRPWAIPTPD